MNLHTFVLSYLEKMVQDEIFITILPKIQHQIHHLLFVLESEDVSNGITDTHLVFENHLQLQVDIQSEQLPWDYDNYLTNLKKEVLDINTKLEVRNVKDEAIKTEEFVIEDILGAIEDDIKDTIEEDDDCIKINIKKKKQKKIMRLSHTFVTYVTLKRKPKRYLMTINFMIMSKILATIVE